MISLYCEAGKNNCRDIREKLEELTLEYHYIEVDAEHYDGAEQLPQLVDEGRKFCGSEEIDRHIEELSHFAADWRKFQSDSCYCDDSGNVI